MVMPIWCLGLMIHLDSLGTWNRRSASHSLCLMRAIGATVMICKHARNPFWPLDLLGLFGNSCASVTAGTQQRTAASSSSPPHSPEVRAQQPQQWHPKGLLQAACSHGSPQGMEAATRGLLSLSKAPSGGDQRCLQKGWRLRR